MKKSTIILLSVGLAVFGTSCKKYLNINTNPNQPTGSSPSYVLPQAIVYTASNENQYNTYGAQLGGFMANAGGYGGFGTNWTYNFATTDYNYLWTDSYDALQDLQYVISATDTSSSMAYYTAAADIMKAYNYEELVDTYNDIPYSKALLGQSDVSPTYDSAATVYVGLANLLDSAIALINNAPSGAQALSASIDPLFSGNMTMWKQLANTIKLRLIVHASAVTTFPNKTFDAAGFLSTDAMVNPGYTRGTVSGPGNTLVDQQTPEFASWVGSSAGAAGNRAWMACTYSVGFYDGNKLLDSGRGKAIYFDWEMVDYGVSQTYLYGAQLGTQNSTELFAPSFTGAWYSTAYSGQPASSFNSILALGNNVGVIKGPNAGTVLMLASEAYFLRAEAGMRNITSDNPKIMFDSGIYASFNYLYELPSGAIGFSLDPAADAIAYKAENPTSYLVNYNLASGSAQQLEAIITQKYIAMNMVTSNEAWNEYRRTGYPKSANEPNLNPYLTFASTRSQATVNADWLPTRIMYPNTEYSSNATNVPAGISPYTSKIFWAR
jgi:hypothetical protein